MEKKIQKHYTDEKKVAILRMHLLEKTPISDLCDQHSMHLTMFYRWQKEFFENGILAFKGT
ncbi:MAG: transposase, partial [Magnetococcales bacterium]|nr:transposase [Magnetococcales bacterium]